MPKEKKECWGHCEARRKKKKRGGRGGLAASLKQKVDESNCIKEVAGVFTGEKRYLIPGKRGERFGMGNQITYASS